jgi:hypothetical protein
LVDRDGIQGVTVSPYQKFRNDYGARSMKLYERGGREDGVGSRQSGGGVRACEEKGYRSACTGCEEMKRWTDWCRAVHNCISVPWVYEM